MFLHPYEQQPLPEVLAPPATAGSQGGKGHETQNGHNTNNFHSCPGKAVAAAALLFSPVLSLPHLPPKAALLAGNRAANAVPPRELWGSGNFDSVCRGVNRPHGSGAGGCGRGAKGQRHGGPHSYPGMLLAATYEPRGSPDGHRDLQRAPEALCQPRIRVPISGADPVRLLGTVPSRACPRGDAQRPSGYPEHPRPPGLRVPVPAQGEPRAVRGRDPPTPFRPVPSRLACSLPAPLRSALSRHGTARHGRAAPR